MKNKVLALLILVVFLVSGCGILFDSDGDDYDEWDESGDEVYYDDDEEDESDIDDFDDDPLPIITNNDLFLRDFSLPLPLFSMESAWNQRADQAKVLPESDQQILSFFHPPLFSLLLKPWTHKPLAWFASSIPPLAIE